MPTPAADLYQGDLFRKALIWARREGYAEVAILSAKRGLVLLHQVVEPYDDSLTIITMVARRRWAEGVLADLQERWSLVEACEITFLAGRRYTEPLVEVILAAAPRTDVRRPLAGLGIGRQKAWPVKPGLRSGRARWPSTDNVNSRQPERKETSA